MKNLKNIIGKPQHNWSGRWGFAISAVSSAIGLANIWKFPYMVGRYGGGAFVLVYLLFLLLAGLPLLLSEVALGQNTQAGPASSFYKIKSHPFWRWWPKIILITGFCVSAYYSVVAGWFVGYGFMAVNGSLSALQNSAEAKELFESIALSPLWAPLLALLFFWTSVWIVRRGVQGGIEWASRWMVPLLFIMLISFSCWISIELGSKQVNPFFNCDFSKLGAGGILAALGHSFFTLSLGQGTMIAYGSYLGREEKVISMTSMVALCDTVVSLLAAYIVMGLCALLHVEIDAGPSLVFETLPVMFNQFSYGQVLSVGFFLILLLATITSEISVVEPVIAYVQRRWVLCRQVTCAIMGSIISLLVIPISLSTYIEGSLGFSLLAFFDKLCTTILIPMGGLTVACFVALVWGSSRLLDQLQVSQKHKVLRKFFSLLLVYITPLLILTVFLQAIIAG